MSTHTFRAMFFAIAAALLAGLCAGTPAFAQQETDGATAEGIQVHGHWVIEVYEVGDLVNRKVFENALTAFAPALISDVLTSEASSGNWQIYLEDCVVLRGAAYGCPIENVVAQSPTSGDNAGAIVLTGSTTISDDGSISGGIGITSVETRLGVCGSSVTPSGCTDSPVGDGTNTITSKILASPIPVEDGQQVNVTVIISFTG